PCCAGGGGAPPPRRPPVGGGRPPPPRRARGRAGALPHRRRGPARDDRGRGPPPLAPRPLPRRRPHRARSDLARAPAPDPRGAPAPDHALLPHAVNHAPARVLRGAGGAQVAREGNPRRDGPGPAPAGGAHPMSDRRLGWLMLAPAFLLLGGLTVYPALWVIW